MAMTLSCCGDSKDEPVIDNGPVKAYPTLPDGHKLIKSISQVYENSTSFKATASYDSNNHLTSISVERRDHHGKLLNKESLEINYKTSTMKCDFGVTSATFSFEVNDDGTIKNLVNVDNKSVVYALFTYSGGLLDKSNNATTSNSTTTDYTWSEKGLTRYVESSVSRSEKLVFGYDDTSQPNVGSIDVTGMGDTPFSTLANVLLKSAGLFGGNNAMLPTSVNKTIETSGDQYTSTTSFYSLTYVLDSDGCVTSCTANDSPSYTMTFTYK